MIYIKNENDVALIKQAAHIWKQVRAMLIETVKPGISLIELDEKANTLIQNNKGTCSFYQYNGFPKHICISVNEQLIHGVPNNYTVKAGDKITFDVGVTYEKHTCDAAYTVIVGKNNLAKHISEATHEALMHAIAVVKPGNFTGDISYAIQTTAAQYGYEVIKDFGGHGCGNKVHEDPLILNYGVPQTGVKLVKGMVLCIEPMLMTNSDEYYIDPKNKWTVISSNHKLTCHWEHMVLVTNEGYEILTL